MTTITKSFRFMGATISVLSNGRAVRESITGVWLMTEVGGESLGLFGSVAEAVAASR